MTRVVTESEPTADQPLANTGNRPLNWSNSSSRAATRCGKLGFVQLLPRDREVLVGVARFGALTTAQIRALFFHDLASDTPCTRVLKRLVEQGMLARVAIRMPSSVKGGSPMGCYQVGKTGWRSVYAGKYRPLRDQFKLMHTLAVADTYIAIKQAERDGWLRILQYSTEPDSHVNVRGADLRPDLFVDLGLIEKRQRVVQFLEVDLGTERQRHIIEKIERYKYAYQHSAEYDGDIFPVVVFISPIVERVEELRQIAKRVRDVPDSFVQMVHADDYPQLLR